MGPYTILDLVIALEQKGYNALVSPQPSIATGTPWAQQGPAARALVGFLPVGFLLALLGAILPAWGYHLRSDFITVGRYFLCAAAGLILSWPVGLLVLARRGVAVLVVIAYGLGCASLLYVWMASPPLGPFWRMSALVLIGLDSGLLITASLYSAASYFRMRPGSAMALCSIFFSLGCAAAAMLMALAPQAHNLRRLALPAVAMGAVAFLCFRRISPADIRPVETSLRQDFHTSPGSKVSRFAFLLALQFGNEWSIAGWLPIFLIRRLGTSPVTALLFLVLYWLCLLLGRAVAASAITRFHAGKWLLGSGAACVFGCLVLFSTNNLFGILTGVLLISSGFASVYPFVAGNLENRFSSSGGGSLSGIASLTLATGMLAPWLSGYAAAAWGIGAVIALPLAGSFIVYTLVLLVWLDMKITGS